MNELLALGLLVVFFWGVWGFTAKLAANALGLQALFWVTLLSDILVIAYVLYKKSLFPLKADAGGMFYAAIAGITGGLALICLYILLEKHEASLVIPLTALYPAVTAVLAILFLGEKVTAANAAGIVLAVLAGHLIVK